MAIRTGFLGGSRLSAETIELFDDQKDGKCYYEEIYKRIYEISQTDHMMKNYQFHAGKIDVPAKNSYDRI